MQNLFNTYTGPKVGLSIDPNWRLIQSGLKRNISTAVMYYRQSNFRVKGNHVLVRLLNSAAVSIDGGIESFYNARQADGVRLTTTFGITSSLSHGTIFEGTFLGKGSKEIIVACDDYINPVDLEANWQDIRAVNFLDHPKSDTSLLLPTGKSYSIETGYSVISINMPALLVQYRCWLKEQKDIFDSGGAPDSTSVFVHQYVLPNMLYSQMDICVFNRLEKMSTGAPMGQVLYRHAFTLIDYSDRLDKSLKQLVKKMANYDRDFYTMMREVPMIDKNNLLELSMLPENAPTRQVVWAEIIARIKLIGFLLEINPSNGRKLSGMQLNHLKKTYDRFENAKGLEQIGDKGLIHDIEAELIRVRLFCKM